MAIKVGFDFSNSPDKSIKLEQLQALRLKREKEALIQGVREQATTRTSTPRTQTGPNGMTLNLGNKVTSKFNPDKFIQELESIDPEQAQIYKGNRAAAEKANLELDLQKKLVPLQENIVHTDALKQSFDIFNATGNEAAALEIINQYEPEGERTTRIQKVSGGLKYFSEDNPKGDILNEARMKELNVNHETQLSQYNDMIKHWTSLQADKTKSNKPSLPRALTSDEFSAASILIEETPGMPSDSDVQELIAADLVTGINDLQTKAKNEGKEIPSTDDLRPVVLEQLKSKLFNLSGDIYGTNATYITSKDQVSDEDLIRLVQQGDLTAGNINHLIKIGRVSHQEGLQIANQIDSIVAKRKETKAKAREASMKKIIKPKKVEKIPETRIQKTDRLTKELEDVDAKLAAPNISLLEGNIPKQKKEGKLDFLERKELKARRKVILLHLKNIDKSGLK